MAIHPRLSGRFARVSRMTYHDGVILIGFCGDIYPHDLTADEIMYIKSWYNMPKSTATIYNSYPDDIEPAYPSVKSNFRNGFLLLK